MATFEHTVLIRRPPEAVFHFLMTPENNVTWQPNLVVSQAVAAGPVAVGWRFRESRHVLGRLIATEFAVLAYDPPRYCAIQAVTSLAEIRASYRLRPHLGDTALTAAGEIPSCALGHVARSVIARTARRELVSCMARLKEVLERVPAPSRVVLHCR